jgi:hypothetical protein
MASGDLAAIVRARLQRGGDRRLAVGGEAVDQAEPRRLLRIHPAAGIDELAHHAFRDEVGEALQRAEIGGDRHVHFGDLEEGVGRWRRAGRRRLARSTPAPMQPPWTAATTGTPACSTALKASCSHWMWRSRASAARPGIVGGRELAGGIFEVEPGGEVLAAAGQQDAAHRGSVPSAAEGLADRGEHLAVHGVELVLAGELDMGDAALVA